MKNRSLILMLALALGFAACSKHSNKQKSIGASTSTVKNENYDVSNIKWDSSRNNENHITGTLEGGVDGIIKCRLTKPITLEGAQDIAGGEIPSAELSNLASLKWEASDKSIKISDKSSLRSFEITKAGSPSGILGLALVDGGKTIIGQPEDLATNIRRPDQLMREIYNVVADAKAKVDPKAKPVQLIIASIKSGSKISQNQILMQDNKILALQVSATEGRDSKSACLLSAVNGPHKKDSLNSMKQKDNKNNQLKSKKKSKSNKKK